MKWGSAFPAVLSAISGVVAAWYWLRSSKVRIVPTWEQSALGYALDHQEYDEFVKWILAHITAFSHAAALSRTAAFWTAASVALSAVAVIVTLSSS